MDVDVVPPLPPVQYMDVDPTPWPAELDLQAWCIVPPRPLVHSLIWDVRRTNKHTAQPKHIDELPAWAVILPDLPQVMSTFDGTRRTISSRKAEKAPVRDVSPEAEAVEAIAEEVHAPPPPPPRIDMVNMASTSQVKLEDLPPCTGAIWPSKPINRLSQIAFESAGENHPGEQEINGNAHVFQPVTNVIVNEILDVEMAEAAVPFVPANIVQPQIPFHVATYPTLNPVVQPNIDEAFLRFNQEISHQVVDDHWRMIDGAADHNVINDSVMFEDDYVDYSHLPTEYMDLDFPLRIVSAPNHPGHDSPGHVEPIAMECDPCGSPVSPVQNDEGHSSEQQAEDQEFVAEQEENAQDEPNTCSSETEESGTVESGEGQAEEDGELQGEEREEGEEEEEEEEESEEERKARIAQLHIEIFGDGEESDDEEEARRRLMDNMDTAADHCSVTSEDSSSGDSHSMSSDATTESTECSTVEGPSLYTDAEGDRLIVANDDGFVDMDAPWLSGQFAPNVLEEDRAQEIGRAHV